MVSSFISVAIQSFLSFVKVYSVQLVSFIVRWLCFKVNLFWFLLQIYTEKSGIKDDFIKRETDFFHIKKRKNYFHKLN